MGMFDKVFAFGMNHSVKTGVTAGILGVGGYAASRTWESHKGDDLEDRIGNTVATGIRVGIGATAAIGAVALAGKRAGNSVGPTLSKPIGEAIRDIPGVKSMGEAFQQPTLKEAVGKLPFIKNIPHPMKTWKNLGPVGRVGAIGLGSIAVAAGSKAFMGQAEYALNDVASPDGNGSMDIQQSNVKQRLNSMSATGDIVLGLHNKR